MLKKIFQKYFTKAFLLNTPLVINTLIALITLPIILKSLPIAVYGRWQFVLALEGLFLSFSAPNIITGAKKGIANNLNGTCLFAFLARLKFLLPIGLVVILISILFKFLGHLLFFWLLIIMGFYLIIGILPQVSSFEFLIAKKKFKKWCFGQILISSISMIGSAIVAYLTKNIIYFVFFQLGSNTVLGWIIWVSIIKRYGIISAYKKGKIDKGCKIYGLKLMPVDLIFTISAKISYFIISLFSGFSSLAIFSIANKLKEKGKSITKSVSPLFYADFAKTEKEKLIKIINKFLIKINVIGLALTLGFIGAGWIYINFFLPKTYQSATVYFIILSLGFPAAIMNTFLHTTLESHLRYKELAVIGIIPNILKILLILFFGYFWKIIGVCIALALSSWINFFFYYLVTIKKDLAVNIIKRYPFLEKLAQKY